VNELALFAGAGGGILGGKLLGWRTICAVEWDAYAASVLVARQNDGCLEPFPIWDDVQTFDGKPWRGRVDVVSGGFPCTDISCAGKGAGIDGEASGMWRHMARIVGEVRPRFVFVENSPMLVVRGLDRVLGDLAALGYDARWGIVGAIHTGAPHRRDRIWIVADAGEFGFGGEKAEQGVGRQRSPISSMATEWWRSEPEQIPREITPRLDGVAHGVAARVDRLRCIGNGQVPAVVRLAWNLLAPTT
jgi:DNA (cytosine-5)-methyltransferase 1